MYTEQEDVLFVHVCLFVCINPENVSFVVTSYFGRGGVCVLLCVFKPILGNRYGHGVSSRAS